MTTGAYSFLDIAVSDGARHHFAVGDPLILLSADLRTLVWVNGPGAILLGFDNIEDALSSPLKLGENVRRQIRATLGFPALETPRALTIRLNSGLQSAPLNCSAGKIVLPDGNDGILLAVANGAPPGLDETRVAARAISGFDAPGRCAALVDADGDIVSAGSGFSGDAISPDTVRTLVRKASGERDRLVRRVTPGPNGDIAAGIGRLTDVPALYLLIAVEDTTGADGRTPDKAAGPQSPVVPAEREAGTVGDAGGIETVVPARPRDLEEQAEDTPERAYAPINEGVRSERSAHDKPGADKFARSATEAVRFVWRTDARGRFSAISEEFATAVGTETADMIGRTFADVAKTLGIDADGEIAGLLDRRDTWSGRSVMWPLVNEAKRVPVDLAALPAYSRERIFEGFRGFGVARLSETVEDEPDAGRPSATDPADDPFPGGGESDKIIRLAAHRQGSPGVELSETEESAFREIGERLKNETDTGDESPTASGADDKTDIGQRPLAPETRDGGTQAEHGRSFDDAPDDKGIAIATSGFMPSAFAAPVWPPAGGSDVSVLEQLPVAVLIRSGDALHYVNPEFLRLTGYRSIDELDRAGGFDVLFAGPDGLSEDDEDPARPAMRLITRDGSEKLCEAHLRSVGWGGNRALMLAVRPVSLFSPPMDGPESIDDDLNDRIRELTAILDTATDGVVLLTPSGSIRSLNRSAEALFGFDSGELIGKPFKVLFAFESQRAADDYLSGLSGNGVASVLNDGREVIGREARGRFIPLFMTMGKLPGERGYCAVMRDITPWKRAEEEFTRARGQAERASSLKTDFLAKISHEVRTPLNAIIGFSELMIDEKFGPVGNARYTDYLRDINRSGNHVLDLVNDLLDISKIEAGEQDMEFESVSLNDALAYAVAIMQPQANRERVIIRSSFASNLPEVVADLKTVRQIALNLLSNAIRFTPAGGQVIVSTVYEPAGDVIMRVRDTGIGMSRVEIEQAMRPFRQIRPLNTRRGDGTGLGLPLTKAMVEGNRAGFAIDSKPDEGTVVEVTFPPTRVLAD